MVFYGCVYLGLCKLLVCLCLLVLSVGGFEGVL